MPTRAQLRATARTDLEKAIAAHGGPAAVAKRLGWRLPYKASAPASLIGQGSKLRRLGSWMPRSFCRVRRLPRVAPALQGARASRRCRLGCLGFRV